MINNYYKRRQRKCRELMDENNILLERLKANDEAAYQELFETYFKQLHHFAE